MRRGFVAVVPPEAVLDALAARVAALAELAGVRWSARDQWHLTVQFLGDADLDAVVGALDGLPGPATSVRLGGAGAFPRPERARVAWVGLCEGGDDLGALATEVATRTAGPGHAPAVPPYHPHVTIARGRGPRDVRPLVAALGDEPVGPAWTVGELVVFESRTDRDRARYTARARIPLTS